MRFGSKDLATNAKTWIKDTKMQMTTLQQMMHNAIQVLYTRNQKILHTHLFLLKNLF